MSKKKILKRFSLFFVIGVILNAGCGKVQKLNAATAPRITVASAIDIPLELSKPGNVSAAIYDSDGCMVRELLRAAPMTEGKHAISWDGLDRYGKAMAPGEYVWRLLCASGFEAKFLGMIGINVIEQPYDPWVGNNDGPSAVAWDETGWYVGSVASETIPTYRKQSPDGTARIWQKDHAEAWQGPVAMASSGGFLYVLQQNAKVVPFNSASGAFGTYGDDAGKNRPVSWDVLAPGDNRNGSGGATTGTMDMDACSGQLVVSYEKFNLVRWYSTEPFTIPFKTSESALQELTAQSLLREEKIDQPKGVAFGPEGITYVITDGAVIEIGKERRVFIPANQLEAPYRVAFDPSSGDLLVAEGDPSHQVKRFDRSGKLIATYGKKGGRADGHFLAQDFLNIRDIVATDQGGFLLSEGSKSLRRTARFDRAGKLIGQWFGGSPYYNFSSATPDKPDEIWFTAGSSSLGVARMSFDQSTWKLIASYNLTAEGDGLFPTHSPFAQWHVLRRDGVTYLQNDNSAILRLDEATQKLRPFAIAGSVNKKSPSKLWTEAVAFQNLDPNKLTGACAWSDVNGDGQFQPEEFRLGGQAQRSAVGNCYIDENWNLLFGISGSQIPWISLTNLAPDKAAAPIWDWNEAEAVSVKWPEEIDKMGGAESRGIWRDAEGATYLLIAANRAPKADRHGAAWPGTRSGAVRLLKWDAEGTLVWTTGKHAHLNPKTGVNPGEYHDPTRILGISHDCLVVADRVEWPATAWTLDGLYAGSFLDRRADDGLPLSVYSWFRERQPVPDVPGRFVIPPSVDPDNAIPYDILTGGSMLTLPDGDVLWMPQGENATPVYRVSGWKGWERKEGRITLKSTPLHALGEGTGLGAEYFNNLQLEGAPMHMRIDSQIWFGFKWGYGQWLPWSTTPVPGLPDQGFSARWTGFVEPLLGEAYTFSIYLGSKDRARLWVGDQLVIDAWEPVPAKSLRPKATYGRIDELTTRPIALKAGVRVPVRLEYVSEGPEQASLSLNWDSPTQERQHIPSKYLYPSQTTDE